MTRIEGGGLAGLMGGFVLVLYGSALKALRLLDRTFVDFGKALIMNRIYPGAGAFLVGLIAHLVISTVAGVLLAYILKAASYRWSYLKGTLWGATVWVILASLGTLFHLPRFVNIPPRPAIGGLIGSIIFGIAATYILQRLNPQMADKSE